MKKILLLMSAFVSAERIAFGTTLFLAVASLAIYHTSSSSEYSKSTNTFPSIAGNLVPEAGDLSTHIASDVGGLNAPTEAAVTQTSPGEFLAPSTGDEPSSDLSNADETSRPTARPSPHLKEAGAAGRITTQASDAGGYSGAGISRAGSSSVGAAGGFAEAGRASSGGATGGFAGSGSGNSGGAIGTASHRPPKNGAASDRNSVSATHSASAGSALPDARDVNVASGTGGNPTIVSVPQDPITGPTAPDVSGGSSAAPIGGNSSGDDFGLVNSSVNGGTNTFLAATPLTDQPLDLLTDQTRVGIRLAPVARAPDASSTLLLLGCGIVALFACKRRGCFQFSCS